MNNIVLDTNVLLSGMLWRGQAHNALQIVVDSYQIVQNGETLKEFAKVIERPKFRKVLIRRQYTADMLIDSLFCQAAFYETSPTAQKKIANISINDKDDLKFIELALASYSRIIVSGDKHLLDLKSVCGISIMSVSSFIDLHLSR